MQKPGLPRVPSLDDLTKQTEIHVDVGALNTALALHPGRYAWWAMHEVEARHRVRELQRAMAEFERTVKELEARLYLTYSRPAEGKGPTVDQIKSSVAADVERRAAEAARNALQEQLDAAAHVADQLRVGRETMRDMKDALMEIARNLREEIGAGLTPAVRSAAGGVGAIGAGAGRADVQRARERAAALLRTKQQKRNQ